MEREHGDTGSVREHHPPQMADGGCSVDFERRHNMAPPFIAPDGSSTSEENVPSGRPGMQLVFNARVLEGKRADGRNVFDRPDAARVDADAAQVCAINWH